MAIYRGNSGNVKIGGVTYCTKNWELSEQVGILQTTCQSTSAKTSRTYISDGLRNASGSFTFDMSDTITPIRPTISGTVSFQLTDEHNKYSGNCIITSVSTPVSIGELIIVSVNFQVTGDVSITSL